MLIFTVFFERKRLDLAGDRKNLNCLEVGVKIQIHRVSKDLTLWTSYKEMKK